MQGAKLVSVLQLNTSFLCNLGVLSCHREVFSFQFQEYLKQEFARQDQEKLSLIMQQLVKMEKPGHERIAGFDSLSHSSRYPTLNSISGYSQLQTSPGQPFITGWIFHPLRVWGFAYCRVTEKQHIGIMHVDIHLWLFYSARGSTAEFKIYSCGADHKNSL